ncbi:MAG TPA: ATP-binding cassette domain-containing protein [Tissierellales bacterium]|nr:ATP-binding cassette domain-containing protein [Tissierellales bacterium]
MNAIELKNLVKKYNGVAVVDNLNLNINEGDIHGFLGPNGAGKSTTINMICGIIKPTSGKINVYSMDNKKCFNEIKNYIGLVPQNIALYTQFTARENVMFFGRLYNLKGRELKKSVDEALKLTGLSEFSDKKVEHFSGGMKRRLNISCGIVHKPKIIIMDEPTVGIDPQSRNHILNSIKVLNKNGSTVLYCTHYMEEVEAICNRISIIDYGKEIVTGTKEDLKNKVRENRVLELSLDKYDKEVILGLKSIEGVKQVNVDDNLIKIIVIKDVHNLSSIVNYLARKGLKIIHINYSDITLEMVFLTLTGNKLRD